MIRMDDADGHRSPGLKFESPTFEFSERKKWKQTNGAVENKSSYSFTGRRGS